MPGTLVCSLASTLTNRQIHEGNDAANTIEIEPEDTSERHREIEATISEAAETGTESTAQSNHAIQSERNTIHENESSGDTETGNSNEEPTGKTNTGADESIANKDHPTSREGTRQPPAMNTTNLWTNVVFGNDMALPKSQNTTRLVSINVNGVRRGDDYQDVLEMAQSFKTFSVDWATLSETNIDWRSAAKSKFYEKMQKVYHHAKISTSSSIIKYDTIYQPGGTLTMVTDDYTGRVTNIGRDEELGRWSFTAMIGKHGRTILLVTIYKVCNKNSGGSRTAYTQQVSLLLRNGRTVSPRKAFLDDFDQQVSQWLAKGYELIIAGNLNEELGGNLSGFSRISSKHNLVEIIQQAHGINGEPPTYARGCRRLDYIFVTAGLATSVKQCGILPYSDIIDSDHRCLYADFDTAMLLGATQQ
jgi:exonuclease III